MDVLTPWFPPTIKPVHRGEYLTRDGANDDLPTMMLWDGKAWRYCDGTIAKWAIKRGREWRGLAFDPTRAVECSDAETGEPGMWVPKT